MTSNISLSYIYIYTLQFIIISFHAFAPHIQKNKEMERTVPVVDLEKISDQEECKKLREACEKWGCFRIINHSIPATLMEEMKMVVRALLDLPMDIKKRNKDAIPGSGYMAPSAVNPLYEALGLYDLGSSQSVQDFCSQCLTSSEV